MKRTVVLVLISLLLMVALSSCGAASNLVRLAPGLFEKQAQETHLQNPVAQAATPVPTLSPEMLGALETLQEGLASVYNQVSPAVVNIQVVKIGQAPGIQIPAIPGFPIPLPTPEAPGQFRQSGVGSGFVWDTQGHIVTNNHVVDGADQITVTFADGTRVPGELVGADPDSDLAVVKVDLPADHLQPIQVADSTQVRVGQLAIAIGNPFGLEGTMTVGIVSALGRSLPLAAQTLGPTYTIPDVIQTDAPINPGNSGGVLVDIQGRLLGVTTAIESPVRANAGVGFVIPSIIVQKVVPKLIADGAYEHPWIGVSGTTLTSEIAEAMGLDREQRGALVIDVIPNSPADKAGLIGSDRVVTVNEQQMRVGGDVITQIDDQPVQDFEDLAAYLARHTEVGQTVRLTVIRDKEEKIIDLVLGARPARGQAGEPASADSSTGAQAWLGIQGLNLNPQIAEAMGLSPDQKGVLIQQVIEGSPADKADLQGSFKALTLRGQRVLVGGDVITALDGQPIENMADLLAVLRERRPGERVSLTILRNGAYVDVNVELGERPAD